MKIPAHFHPDNDNPKFKPKRARKNVSKRYKLYKKFWTLLFQANAFADDRYLERKQAMLARKKQKYRAQGREEMVEKCVFSNRELLPNCVVTQVRKWYPNPKGVPYKGFRCADESSDEEN